MSKTEKLFTATAYVEWLKEQARLKRPYWFGTYYLECTQKLLDSKSRQNPQHYTDSRMARYKADIAAGQICGDCLGGAVKGAAWSDLGKHKTVYASNGVPDKRADGMYEWCRKQGAECGSISTIPLDCPGVAVRFSGHVGVYVGNGKVVEWRGFNYGCVTTRVFDRPWTHWYALPWVDYDQQDISVPDTLGERTLRKGMKGEDVKALQEALLSIGLTLPQYGADGDYGSETERAVRALQQRAHITENGVYDARTHEALMQLLAERDDEDDTDAGRLVRVRVTGASVNVRAGAGTQFKILTVVHRGDVFNSVGRAANGWYAIRLSSGDGWISPKYTEEV